MEKERDNLIEVFPIIKYQLKDFFNNLDININYKESDNLTGYSRYYIFDVLVNGEDDKLLLEFTNNDNQYNAFIRSMSKSIPNNTTTISVNEDSIDINTKVLFKDVIDNKRIELVNNTIVDNFYINNKLISTYTRELDSECKRLNK